MPGESLPSVTFPLVDGREGAPGTSGGRELLVVYRGRFCPRCKLYLAKLDTLIERLQALDVSLTVVSSDSRENALADRDEHGWRFPLGHSLSLESMRALGLWITKPDPSNPETPYAEPGIFFTTPDGRVQILSTSNAASCRPDLDVLVDGIEATIARNLPIRGLL